MKAMILAAGYGTRLRPLTYVVPKPMVPLLNRPLVGWAVETFLREGVKDIILNLHHLPEAIEQHLLERYGEEINFEFSEEDHILGTGGAVRRVRPLLEHEEEFFLANGDTVQFPPYAAMREARREKNAIAALNLRHAPDQDRFTPVFHEHGLVTGFGKGTGQALMFAGTHLISTRLYDFMPDKEVFGIVDEVYQPLLDSGRESVAAALDDEHWFDIGTPQRYVTASRALLEATARGDLHVPRGSRLRGESMVHETAHVPGSSLTRSVVGARSMVTGDLRDTIVWEDCVISGSASLERCVVGHGVEISGPLELSDALICRDDAAIPENPGYERRDGLVIVRI
jgi:NDP-sugar pyrophosphorylase family protein